MFTQVLTLTLAGLPECRLQVVNNELVPLSGTGPIELQHLNGRRVYVVGAEELKELVDLAQQQVLGSK